MRLTNYTLSPTRINNAKAKAKPYKLSDGGGLLIEVSASGLKTWRYQYRFGGARRDLKIGRYPEIGVADARDRHFELRSLLERGVDPFDARHQELADGRCEWPKRSRLATISKRSPSAGFENGC